MERIWDLFFFFTFFFHFISVHENIFLVVFVLGFVNNNNPGGSSSTFLQTDLWIVELESRKVWGQVSRVGEQAYLWMAVLHIGSFSFVGLELKGSSVIFSSIHDSLLTSFAGF